MGENYPPEISLDRNPKPLGQRGASGFKGVGLGDKGSGA